MATSITQYSITVTFDADYPVGTYLNGDYYVVSASGVSITQITVEDGGHIAGSVADRDGAMINPVPRGSNDPLKMQGYDSRGLGYLASLNKTGSYPFSLAAEQSLVCSQSTTTLRYYSTASNPIYLETAIVLTCVTSAPPANSFRPQYCSGTKTTHNWSSVNTGLLPSLSVVSGTPTLSSVLSWLQRPQIDHGIGWTMRNLHPYQNMHDYGREITEDYGDGLLMSLLNEQSIGDKTTLIQYLIQIGIDLYGISQAGGYWINDGGHGMGRKAPIVFAGALLNVSGMLNIGTSVHFQEDDQTFYVSQADVDRVLDVELSGSVVSATNSSLTMDQTPDDFLDGLTIAITGGLGSGQTRTIGTTSSPYNVAPVTSNWTTNPDATSSYQVYGYQSSDIGLAEWGIRHATSPNLDNPCFKSSYRTLNGTRWYGHALSMAALNLISNYNHTVFFDYLNRYRNVIDTIGGPTFHLNMWDTYWQNYYNISSNSANNTRSAFSITFNNQSCRVFTSFSRNT